MRLERWLYQITFFFVLLIAGPVLLTGATAFFFPLCLRSAKETLSGCWGSSSLLSSCTVIITCRDTRACRAL